MTPATTEHATKAPTSALKPRSPVEHSAKTGFTAMEQKHARQAFAQAVLQECAMTTSDAQQMPAMRAQTPANMYGHLADLQTDVVLRSAVIQMIPIVLRLQNAGALNITTCILAPLRRRSSANARRAHTHTKATVRLQERKQRISIWMQAITKTGQQKQFQQICRYTE